MRIMRQKNLVLGLVLFGVAAMILLRYIADVPDGLYDIFVRGLPAVLVFAGLAIILKNRVPLSNLIALGVSLLIVVVLAFIAYSNQSDEVRDDQQVIINETIPENVSLLIVEISALETEVEVRVGDSREDGITGEFLGSTESTIISTLLYENGADRATYSFREEKNNQFPLLDAIGRGTLDLFIPPDIPVAITFIGLDGDALFDMSSLSLERVSLESTSGDVVVTLPVYEPLSPNAADQPGLIVVNNGNLNVIVPETAGARFELTPQSITPTYPQENYLFLVGGILETRDFDDADIQLRYRTTVPNGQVTISNIVE